MSTSPLLASAAALNERSIAYSELQQTISADLVRLPHLAGLRDFNYANLDAVIKQLDVPPTELRLLDIGGSIHGFALAAAQEAGFREYIGIDLDVTRQWKTNLLRVTQGDRSHLLCQMDAHRLWLQDHSMDVVVCLSGFEHYLFPELVVSELLRVLKPGGIALINYEPIWTCSYGHHLHHYGLGYEQVPPWSHLILTKSQMGSLLAGKNWPATCPIDKTKALDWIYDGREINRRDVRFHRQLLENIPSRQSLWLLPHDDPAPAALAAVDYVSSILGYSRAELLTRGFSCCFRK